MPNGLSLILGDDGVRVMKNNEIQQVNTNSTLAEEAVDQLQASEKLIAGKWFTKKRRNLQNKGL